MKKRITGKVQNDLESNYFCFTCTYWPRIFYDLVKRSLLLKPLHNLILKSLLW